jgi:FG-GAP-like repeat
MPKNRQHSDTGSSFSCVHRDKNMSSICLLGLFLSLLLIGSMSHIAYSGTDVFRSSGGKWQVSFGGTGTWQDINTSSIGLSALRFGDFDGNCRTDIFRSAGGQWRVSFNGTGQWQTINTSSIGVSDLRFGDFNGDGNTDVFRSSGGKWQVSFGGTGQWQTINTSSIGVSDLRFGDFNGDGNTDVFRSSGGKWQVSFGGTGQWQPINTSSIGVSDLGFGDFNGPAMTSEDRTAVCLRVARFRTATLSNADADAILRAASNVLQTDDDGSNSGDVACPVQFTRRGDVTAFAAGDGSIDSGAEFNEVVALPGHVKVVNQINWCSGIGFNIIGCAPVPGNSLVVVRFTANQEGILWAHEYGHTRGLEHNSSVDAVMNKTITTARVMVSPAECEAFRK